MFYIDYQTPKGNGKTLHQVRTCANYKEARARLLATGFKLDRDRLGEFRIVYTNGQTDAVLVEDMPGDGEVVILDA